MKFVRSAIPDVILVEPDVHGDRRGRFVETWHARRYLEAGIDATFVQDNESSSVRGTVRGLHCQRTRPQGKLVRVVFGEILDVAVDVRRSSPTFLKWVAHTLSAAAANQVWVPPGFAHGFLVLSERADVAYKCTDFYAPEDELRIRWNDPQIGIRWPIAEPILAPKDAAAPFVADVLDRLPRA